MHFLHLLAPILITGATGLIGGELLRGLLSEGLQNVTALVRSDPHADPKSRLLKRLARSGQASSLLGEACEAAAGDVREHGLGLSPPVAERLRSETQIIIHSASDTSFIRGRSCHESNVIGMQRLLEFAASCARSPLIVYLSTAANSGSMMHCSLREEDGCRPDARHHNDYTRSKAIAEKLLWESGLPSLVVRPSIVFSAGLPDPAFARAILWFVPLLNAFESVPIDPASRLDAVPVDFVVKSTLDLLRLRQRRFNCYHLSAGHASQTCGELLEFIDRFYERSSPIRGVSGAAWTRDVHRMYVRTADQRKIFSMLRYYLPFLNMDVVYDTARLAADLGPQAVRVPPFSSYMGQLLEMIPYELALTEALNP